MTVVLSAHPPACHRVVVAPYNSGGTGTRSLFLVPGTLLWMALGSALAPLDGYPFEVRHSNGAVVRARAAADVAADAYAYLRGLFSGVEPDIALIVADETDWESRQPYGLPFFNDDPGQIRPGIIVMPAGRGAFWIEMGQDLHRASPRGYRRVLAAYPDGSGGLASIHRILSPDPAI